MTDDAAMRALLRNPRTAELAAEIQAAVERRARHERQNGRLPGRSAYVCEECQDDYWVPMETGGMAPCQACQGRHNEERTARAQKDAGISAVHAACRLDDYEPATPRAGEALTVARQYVDAYGSAETRKRGLYFFGSPGVGKTHLAYGITNALLACGVAALVVRETDLFSRLPDVYGSDHDRADEARRLLGAARKAPLFLLDDLGSAKRTESREEARYAILDHRLHESLPTIITSNHHPDRLSAAIGERTVSRIHGLCYIIPITGPDRRRPREEGV